MSDARARPREEPLIRRAEEIDYEAYDVAPGLRRGVLLNEELHDMPNFAMRRFTLDAGSEVPKHTNEVEHEQYVLAGEYVVGIGDEEYEVSEGDVLYIPAGTDHWYRNESDEQGAFICCVPNGEDEITITE